MNSWFTVDVIDKDTFVISENKHWEETRCYLLCGSNTSLLIDTGLGVADIKNTVDKLTDKPVAAIVTHVHWDHIGGLNYFSDIAVHEAEISWLADRFPLPRDAVIRNLTYKPCDFPVDFRIENYDVYRGAPTRVLRDNDIIDLGNRQLRVIHTPGHSPGHCCFYEPQRKYLFSGDLIYKGCLDIFYPTTDIADFRNSIKKVKSLNVERILPAHHSLDISVDITKKIDDAFTALDDGGRLNPGGGIFDFGDFQIRI